MPRRSRLIIGRVFVFLWWRRRLLVVENGKATAFSHGGWLQVYSRLW